MDVKNLFARSADLFEKLIPLFILLIITAAVLVLLSSGVLSSLDPSALAVIVGILAASVPNLIPQLYREWKQGARWRQEQEKAEVDEIRNVYQNALRAVHEIESTYSDEDLEVGISKEKKLEQIQDAQQWLAHLAILHLNVYDQQSPKTRFDIALSYFTRSPSDGAHSLKKAVVDLAMSDVRVYPRAETGIRKGGSKFVRIYVDEDYRRQLFEEEGIDVPTSHDISCEWSELSPRQRKNLVNLYFKPQEGVPSSIELALPRYKDGKQSGREPWRARLNPKTADIETVFDAWESAYERAVQDGQPEA